LFFISFPVSLQTVDGRNLATARGVHPLASPTFNIGAPPGPGPSKLKMKSVQGVCNPILSAGGEGCDECFPHWETKKETREKYLARLRRTALRLPPKFINSSIKNMRERCQRLHKAKGGHIEVRGGGRNRKRS